eukprot:gene28907-32102_t
MAPATLNPKGIRRQTGFWRDFNKWYRLTLTPTAGFWRDFNKWYRSQMDDGTRPHVNVLDIWYNTHACEMWDRHEMPSWQETLLHACGLRTSEEVKKYNSSYKAKKVRPSKARSLEPTASKGRYASQPIQQLVHVLGQQAVQNKRRRPEPIHPPTSSLFSTAELAFFILQQNTELANVVIRQGANLPSTTSNLPSTTSNLPSTTSNLPSRTSNLPSRTSNLLSSMTNVSSARTYFSSGTTTASRGHLERGDSTSTAFLDPPPAPGSEPSKQHWLNGICYTGEADHKEADPAPWHNQTCFEATAAPYQPRSCCGTIAAPSQVRSRFEPSAVPSAAPSAAPSQSLSAAAPSAAPSAAPETPFSSDWQSGAYSSDGVEDLFGQPSAKRPYSFSPPYPWGAAREASLKSDDEDWGYAEATLTVAPCQHPHLLTSPHLTSSRSMSNFLVDFDFLDDLP